VAGKAAGLIVALVLLAAGSPALARDPARLKTPQVPWEALSPDERRILGPVHQDWPRLPGYQQQRLKGAAKRYPSMRPIQRERFENRIRDWAAMTPEQRRAARETFQGLRKLPPERQRELRQRWLERKRERSGRPDAPRRLPPR